MRANGLANLAFSDRVFVCQACDHTLEKNLNAAINQAVGAEPEIRPQASLYATFG
jgi:transposase